MWRSRSRFVRMSLSFATKLGKSFLDFIVAILDWYWRIFFWLIISVLATGILGNFAYTYVTTCTQKSCSIPFTNPRKWSIVLLLFAHPQSSITVAVLCVILTICAFLVHRWLAVQNSEEIKVEEERLVLIKNFRSKSLNLGDDSAANFPYIIMPIQDVYNNAAIALNNAIDEIKATKRGIFIFGESNAGKTRLAYEILRQTLPSWPILRWMRDYTKDDIPKLEAMHHQRLVIFIDDLQDYAPIQIADDYRAATLRTLIETLLQKMQHAVVVITCRSEDKASVLAAFNWLFTQLEVVTIPTFSVNNQDQQVKQVIAEFQRQGTIHIGDWDGTLGSLVLGLSTKNSQYLALEKSYPSAAIILKAMKLLTKANIVEHTEQRVRAVCVNVFGREELQKKDIWRESVGHLTSLQLIRVDAKGLVITLVIRKDIYFEKVVTDYPQDNQLDQLEQDLMPLYKVLVELQDVDALSNLGIALTILKRYEDAKVVCDEAIKLNPKSVSGWFSKSFLLIVSTKFEEALDVVNHSVSLDPGNAALWQNKGAVLTLLMRYQEALVAFEEAISLGFQNKRACLQKGEILSRLGRFEEALTAFDQALLLDPRSAEGYFCKGLVLRKLKRYEEALTIFERALSLESGYIDAWVEKGSLLKERGRDQEALVALEQALSLDPENVHALCDKGRALGALGRHKEGLIVLDRARVINPKAIITWLLESATLLNIDQYEEALASVNHVLSLDVQSSDGWLLKGFALEGLGQKEEAFRAFNHVLSLSSANNGMWINRGRAFLKLHRHKEALSAFTQAISLNPKEIDGWIYKGKTLMLLGRYGKALRAYEHVLSLDPEHTEGCFNKGLILKRLRRYEEALTTFDYIISFKHRYVEAWVEKGCVLESLGRHKGALEALEQALSFDPQNAHAWGDKGKALMALQQHRKSIIAFDHALSFYPQNANLWFYKGLEAKRLWKDREALAAFEHVFSLKPNYVNALVEKGCLLEQHGQDEEALTVLDQALSLDSKNAHAWTHRFKALIKVGRDQEALVALEHAISLAPNSYLARYYKLMNVKSHGIPRILKRSIRLGSAKPVRFITLPLSRLLMHSTHTFSMKGILDSLEHISSLKEIEDDKWDIKADILRSLEREKAQK